jgi:hypothetical protein
MTSNERSEADAADQLMPAGGRDDRADADDAPAIGTAADADPVDVWEQRRDDGPLDEDDSPLSRPSVRPPS